MASLDVWKKTSAKAKNLKRDQPENQMRQTLSLSNIKRLKAMAKGSPWSQRLREAFLRKELRSHRHSHFERQNDRPEVMAHLMNNMIGLR